MKQGSIFRCVCLLLLVSSIASSILGCAGEKSKKNEDPVLEAYRLIDSQRTDEAIELLEESLADEPNNYDYKVVLASSYAHKAGIKIQKLVPMVNQSEKIKDLNKKSSRISSDQSLSSRVNNESIKLATLLMKFSGLFEVYAAVPVISKNEVTYLNHAIYLLNELGTSIKSEDVLYRVILEVILFKHILAENLIGEFSEPKTKDVVACQINLGAANDSIITLGKLLIDIYTDLGFANPKKAKDMKTMAEDTADLISDVTMATTALTLIDEVSHIFLKQAIIQSGFGKMIKCGNH